MVADLAFLLIGSLSILAAILIFAGKTGPWGPFRLAKPKAFAWASLILGCILLGTLLLPAG